MGTRDRPREVGVVVRHTEYENVGPEGRVDLMKVFSDFAKADAEAARLNSVRRNDRVEYFVKVLVLPAGFDGGGSYSQESGLQLTWQPGYVVGATLDAGSLVISGNEQGLRSLAQHLLTLAEGHVPPGVHAHFEPGLELEEGSLPMIVEKVGATE